MNSEDVPKEIVQSFIDSVNMVKGSMDENQQPAVTQELGRRGGRKSKSRKMLRVGARESSASATDTNNIYFAVRSTIKWTISEIWVSKATSKKPWKSMSHKTTSGKTASNLAIRFYVKPSDFKFVSWFLPFLKSGLPRL